MIELYFILFTLVSSGEAPPQESPYGWDSVATTSIGSGVYLGDGWVISPYHVYQNTNRFVDLLDSRYYEISNTAHRLKYNDSTNTDLIMYRINGDPSLPLITISELSPVNQPVTIIATGRTRVGDLVDFDGYAGYATSSTRIKTWGVNTVESYVNSTSSAFGRTRSFMTVFDIDECQPVNNDSGGSVYNASDELTGLVLAVGVYYGYRGPDITTHAIYGAYAYYANLASYADQIADIRSIGLAGDLNNDGRVDEADFEILLAEFGNGMNLRDFVILRANFGYVSGHGVNANPEINSFVLFILISGCIIKVKGRR